MSRGNRTPRCPTCGNGPWVGRAWVLSNGRGNRGRFIPARQSVGSRRQFMTRTDRPTVKGIRCYWPLHPGWRNDVRLCPDPFHDEHEQRRRYDQRPPEPQIPMHRQDPFLDGVRARRHRYHQRKDKR